MFRLIHKKIHPSGALERLVQEFHQAEVVLGKGGESHIILPGQRVALVHAALSWDGTSLSVRDLGALAGVRLNNRRVSTAVVKSGDVITLGDIRIEIAIDGDCIQLNSSLEAEPIRTEKLLFVQELDQLKVESHLPAMHHIVLGAIVIGLIAFAVYPLMAKDFSPWNSGPISNAHSLIAQDCQKCHADPFVRVQDRECLYCHEMSEHAKGHAAFVEAHPNLEMRCARCHMEHNGDHGLIRREAEFCVGCHSNMQARKPDTGVLNVSHFAIHPQFRVSTKSPQGDDLRVPIDDSTRAVDRSALKFNHAAHLEPGLRGKQGDVTLSCNSCHQADKDYRRLVPVSFEKHCRDCHSLGFDERLPESQVPHGDAEAVYSALITEYTKLLALKTGAERGGNAAHSSRLFPSEQVYVEEKSFQVADISSSAREAELQLFTRTGCFLCHEYQEKSADERADTNSRYQIIKPNVPAVWMPRARFNHGAHEEFSCESCHEKVRNSSKTSDILLPGIAGCQNCHAQDAPLGYVESGCVTCHSYHDAIGFPGEKKQTIVDYLGSLTR